MSVESDTDRLALLADFAVTATAVAGSFTGVYSEADGEFMTAGEDPDGTCELLCRTSDIPAPLAVGDTLTVGGVAYTVSKQDHLAEGLSVLKLSPP